MTLSPLVLDSFDVAYFEAATGKLHKWGPETDPLAKALNVRAAYAAWGGNPLDAYLSANGVFDFGAVDPLVMPSCSVAGLGKAATIYKGQRIIDPNSTGLQFQLRNTTLSDISLINDCGIFDANGNLMSHEDGGCTGFLDGPYSATLRCCSLWSRDWTVYTWAGAINTLLIEDCEITTGRVGVASESSGVGQNITIRRSRICGDVSLSHSNGATSSLVDGGVFGIIHRGGLMDVSDTEISITGGAVVPRACGITDHGGGGDGPAFNARVVLRNFTCHVQSPNPNWYDLDFEADWMRDYLVSQGAWGSESDGSLKRSW